MNKIKVPSLNLQMTNRPIENNNNNKSKFKLNLPLKFQDDSNGEKTHVDLSINIKPNYVDE